MNRTKPSIFVVSLTHENNDGEIVENNDDVDVAHSTIKFIVIVAMYERNRLCNDVNTVHDESAERR